MVAVSPKAQNLLRRLTTEKVLRAKGEQQFVYADGSPVDMIASEQLIETGKAVVEKHGLAQERLVERLW